MEFISCGKSASCDHYDCARLASCVTQLTGSSLRPVDRSISGKRDISVILRRGHGAVITEMFQVCFLLIFLEAYVMSELSGL